MINTLALLGTSIIAIPTLHYVWNYDPNFKEKKKISEKWNNICLNCNLKNKEDIIPFLNNLEKTSFGFKAITELPSGISLEKLEQAKQTLEDNLNCMLEITKDKYDKFVYLNIINKKPEFKYEPVRCDTNSLWIGYKHNGKPYKIKLNQDPHLLIAGTTGTGKTFLLATILANLIYNNPKNIEVYLSQIVKGEIGVFKDCKPVKKVSYSLKETAEILDKLAKKVDKRSKEFTDRGIKNLDQWNSKYGKQDFKKRIFMVIEEVSFFIPEDTENDEIKALKNKCWSNILTIAKAGRSSGVHFLSCTQRSTCANIPSEIKAQMTRISFKQRSVIDSTNIINTAEATRLQPREFIIDGAEYQYLIAPDVDEEFKILQQYVKEIIVPTEENTSKETYQNQVQQQQEKHEHLILSREEYLKMLEKAKMKNSKRTEENKVISLSKNVIQTTDRDKDILKFIENYGAITFKQAQVIFFSNLKQGSARASCSRVLKKLEEKGFIKSEIHKEMKEKVIYMVKSKSIHDLYIINAYTRIKELGAEVLEFKTEHHLLKGKLRPDAYIEFKLQDQLYKAYIECDLSHFTGEKKMQLYERLGEDFVIIIGKEDKLSCSSKKIKLIHTSVDFSNLRNAIKDKLIC
ncbi:FtsK/SpoIIIE domain-containing protein [Clostridium massiliamazoniense]|uniref:FtsK/SpoIIIE domain-containing protein n=1 Tax=Clostridium massiliamazoniense TaxID=1347366 RepID=UPI0006D810D0|nr:FtsK/SpoIIIE domain-containing protein [Clostridium massiliamazoniense]